MSGATMGSVPTLRVAKPGDADQVDALMKESAAGIFPAFYDDQQTASAARHIAEVDQNLLADGTYFVLEVDGELVACGGWSRRHRPYAGGVGSADDDRLLDPQSEAAHVRAMFVRPDWTRRGLGRRIMAECESAARREGFTRLALVATLPGVPLYLACGFTPMGPEEDIVLVDGVRLPCVEMTKTIDATVGVAAN